MVILATGGTIAGATASGTQAAYTSGAVTIDGMIAAVPGINDLANLKGEQIRSRGVLVVMNDWIHAAHSLTKTSTTAVQTFMSPLRGLVGVSTYGKNDFYNTPPWKNTVTSEFDVTGVGKLRRVDILYAYADMSHDLIDASVANGVKGIVIAGVVGRTKGRQQARGPDRQADQGRRRIHLRPADVELLPCIITLLQKCGTTVSSHYISAVGCEPPPF